MNNNTQLPNSGENKWNVGLAERYVPPFTSKWTRVGPRHSLWHERVKLEIISVSKYVQFLKSELPRPWFMLKPDANPKYNFCLWRGYLQIPAHPQIRFEMVILLSSEYPQVIPRCFLEKRITNYCGKIYLKNVWKDPQSGKEFVMICHDHMSELAHSWDSSLGIVHFFIREVWFWFAAMQNIIIEEYRKQHGLE